MKNIDQIIMDMINLKIKIYEEYATLMERILWVG